MRIVVFLLLMIPALSNAQFKRSATELAKENIRGYVSQKLFKNLSYEPVAYGELTDFKGGTSMITSLIRHRFTITDVQSHDGIKIPVQKQYVFVFYFDDKMQVKMAESISSQ